MTEVTLSKRLAELATNVALAEAKHGSAPPLLDGTGGLALEGLAEIKRARCEAAAKAGSLTWRLVLEEEVAEAFAETDQARLRAELLDVATATLRWNRGARREVEAVRLRERLGFALLDAASSRRCPWAVCVVLAQVAVGLLAGRRR